MRKSKVIRINEKEEKVMSIIKEIGIDKFIDKVCLYDVELIKALRTIKMNEEEYFDIIEDRLGYFNNKALQKMINDGKNICINGQANAGKTTFIKYMIKNIFIKEDIPVFVLNDYNEYSNIEDKNVNFINALDIKTISLLANGKGYLIIDKSLNSDSPVNLMFDLIKQYKISVIFINQSNKTMKQNMPFNEDNYFFIKDLDFVEVIVNKEEYLIEN